VAAVLTVVGFGFFGGFLATNVWPARPPLVAPDTDPLRSTVQEVTISPNIEAMQLLEQSHRSVVLIGGSPETAGEFATGVVVTNDGLIVTADTLPDGDPIVFDYQGRALEAQYVGQDELFGLVFLRMPESVLVPMDLRTTDVSVAEELLAISRSDVTFMPKVLFFRVLELTIPPELMPRGVRQVLRGMPTVDSGFAGSPLIDDDGRLAGLVVNPGAGLALPAHHIRESIDRVASGKREFDPFAEIGITVRYIFTHPEEADSSSRFAVEVTGVAPQSPAAAASLTRGDLIVAIGEMQVGWNESVLAALSGARPLTLTVQRAGTERTVHVSP
jgi:S1-C subfamily serine protease